VAIHIALRHYSVCSGRHCNNGVMAPFSRQASFGSETVIKEEKVAKPSLLNSTIGGLSTSSVPGAPSSAPAGATVAFGSTVSDFGRDTQLTNKDWSSEVAGLARFVRGVGLTPRLFEKLVHPPSGAPPPVIQARQANFVPAVARHVQSVKPNKAVMAEYWCPVVVEDEEGQRFVLHVDPIAVRQFRRMIAQEFQQVQEKRELFVSRIKSIRQEFPKVHCRDLIARIQREIADAEGRSEEQLIPPLPEETRTLHVFIEATPNMTQLDLVRKYLMEELVEAFQNGFLERVCFGILGFREWGGLASLSPEALECRDVAALAVVADWLQAAAVAVQSALTRSNKKWKSGSKGGECLRMAKALRQATTIDTLGEGHGAILFVVCSPPEDLPLSIGLVRRSPMSLQIAGVYGTCPLDPEPALQQLVDAAAPGSSLQLFFGPEYWSRFVEARGKQLAHLEAQECGDSPGSWQLDDDEVVSAKMLEMRLIERLMRECYAEAQQCEEELVCATRVLERTLVDREDIVHVLREEMDSPRPTAMN